MDENGKLVAKELEVEGRAKFKDLTEFENLTKFGTPENSQGITIYDRATGQPICAFFKNELWKSETGECGIKLV